MAENININSGTLLEVAAVVNRLQGQRPRVLTPKNYRLASATGYLLLVLAIFGSPIPGLLYRLFSKMPRPASGMPVMEYYANLMGLAVSLIGSWASGILLYRRPKSRATGSFFSRASSLYGPYDTREILAMAFYGYECAARARESSERAPRLLRMCREYLYCPITVAWAADQNTHATTPGSAEGNGNDAKPVSSGRMLFLFVYAIFPRGGNSVATAWFHLSQYASAAPANAAVNVETLTRLWCEVVYRFFVFERDHINESLSGVGALIEEITATSRRLFRELPTPSNPPSLLTAYREWILTFSIILVFWIGAFSFGFIWPQALPAFMMAALVASGGAVLTGWNLHASRKRAEKPNAATASGPRDGPSDVPALPKVAKEPEEPKKPEQLNVPSVGASDAGID